MAIEFQVGPKPSTPEYRQAMSKVIASSRVAASGYFDEFGVFTLVPWGQPTTAIETEYWALNLLRFSSPNNGVWSWSNGTMTVFDGRMEMSRGQRTVDLAKTRPLHTLDPGNVRTVSLDARFSAIVSESGWLTGPNAAYQQRLNGLKDRDLDKILEEAVKGVKPHFFDYHMYTQVAPGYVGRRVHVVPFEFLSDGVVIDAETKKLLPARHTDILSRENWG